MVNAGSLLEDIDQRGLAHIVEHLAFNGSKRFPKQAVVKYLEERGMNFGAHTNAYTSYDETVYQMQIPTDSLSVMTTALDIVADWVSALTLDSAAIEKERGIVIEEWRLGYLGVQGRITTRYLESLYHDSRYAERLTIGTKSSLDSFRVEAVRRFYRDWYVPQNMALVIVGDIQPDSLERSIREHLAVVPPRIAPRLVAQERDTMGLTAFNINSSSPPRITVVIDKEMPNTICVTNWRHLSQPITTKSAYRQHLLRVITLALTNNRLQNRATASAKPPFRSASVSFEQSNRVMATSSLSVEPSDALFTSYEAVLAELYRICRDGFLPSEIRRVQASLRKSILTTFNERQNITSAARAEECIANALTGAFIISPEDRYRLDSSIIAGVSAEDVRQTAQILFPLGSAQQLTFIATSPQDSTGITQETVRSVLRRAETTQLDSFREDTSRKPLLTKLPQLGALLREHFFPRTGITEWRLSNGVRVLLKPTTFKNDQVLLQSVAEGGLSLAAEAQYLAAKMAATLQAPSVAGVGMLTASDLTKFLADKSVSVIPYTERFSHGMNGVSSASDVETLLQLFYAAHIHPRRDSASMDVAKERERQSFGNRANHPANVLQDSIDAVLYSNHYAARSSTLSEIEAWHHLDSGYNFYKRLFGNMRGGTVVLVGAFDIKRIKPLVLRYCGGLPTAFIPHKLRDNGGYPADGKREVIVRKGSDNQAMTYSIYTNFLPEWTLKLDVTADIMREIADTKLREVLRNDAGGVYASGVSVDFSTKPRPRFIATVFFPSETGRANELYERTTVLLKNLAGDAIQEKDLQEAKTKLRKARELSLQDNASWLSRLTFWAQQGETPERILEYREILNAVTLNEVRTTVGIIFQTPNVSKFVLMPTKAE